MLKSFSLAALTHLAASASLQIPYYADVTQE
jgi:C1A family cysteine protease